MIDALTSRSIWQMAAKPLIGGAVMCIIATAMVVGAIFLAKKVAVEQGKAQATLNAANLSLQNTQSDRARLEENLQMFGKLKTTRFIQAPDRLVMLEVLQGAAAKLRKTAVAWELGAEQIIRPLNDDKTGEMIAKLVRVPMKISALGVHEQEWVGMLAEMQGGGAGYFTVDSCNYDAKQFVYLDIILPAVDARCELSWLYVVPQGVKPKVP